MHEGRNPLLAEDRFETEYRQIILTFNPIDINRRNPLLAEDRFETNKWYIGLLADDDSLTRRNPLLAEDRFETQCCGSPVRWFCCRTRVAIPY